MISLEVAYERGSLRVMIVQHDQDNLEDQIRVNYTQTPDPNSLYVAIYIHNVVTNYSTALKSSQCPGLSGADLELGNQLYHTTPTFWKTTPTFL